LLVFETAVLPRFERDFEVMEGTPTRVELHVPAGVAASGTLRGPDGRPLAGVRLRIGDARPVATDDAGRFAFPRIAAGTQGVWIHDDLGEVRIGSVEASAASDPRNLDVRTLGTSEVTATLVGSPIAALYAQGGRDPRGDRSAMLASTRPDANGRIRIRHLAAGAYWLFAYGRDANDEDRQFDLAEGQVLDLGEIRLVPTCVVEVRVTVPLGSARPTIVSALPVDERGWPLRGRSGRIEFDGEGRGWLKGLAAGDYRLVFSANGFAQSAPTPVTVREGAPVPLAIELKKP
jgi:hypothetical protein